jgi:hypothetical protein
MRALIAELTPAWILSPDHAGDAPKSDDAPMPAPTWKPEVKEPEPDELPDERPLPNPDENRGPPQHAAGATPPKPFPEPDPDPQPTPPPGPNPIPMPSDGLPR